MKFGPIAAIAALGVALSGCATVIEGTSQDITVVTSPPDASCVFMRHGETIGSIPHTPGMLTVKRRKYDITIDCDKPGYRQASYLNHSGLSTMVVGNVVADVALTAGLASIVDSASGADNQYERTVTMTLLHADANDAPPSAPPPQTPAAPSSPGH